MNEIANVSSAAPMTAAQVKQQVALINEILQGVMIPELHYDTIPGCGKKPVLLKPGAEKILTTFRIGVEIAVEDLSDGFDFRYRVTCRGFYIPTGNTVGFGVGEASTAEKKYKWREAVCDEEFDATPETRRQIYWKKDNGETAHSVKQVRQNPADLANTVLKMAKKRAMVDLCLTSTACSDIFEQDLDEGHLAEAAGAETGGRFRKPRRREEQRAPQPQQPPAQGGPVITDAQKRRLYAIGKERGLSDEEMSFINFDHAGVNDSRQIPGHVYDSVVEAYRAAEPGRVIPQA